MFDYNPDKFGIEPVLSEVELYIQPVYGTWITNIDIPTDTEGLTDEEVTYYQCASGMKNVSRDPVWSPDNDRIAVIGNLIKDLWIISPDGEEHTLVPGNPASEEYSDYLLPLGIDRLCGFSPDGKELYYCTSTIDEERGTVVTINDHEGGFGYHINGSIPVIKAVNVETGEIRIVMYSAAEGRISNSGRYLAYRDSETKYLMLYDNETGETTTLYDEYTRYMRFSGDDTYIIAYSEDMILNIPVDGSEPQVLFEGRHLFPDISTDGRWIIYKNYDDTLSRLHVYNTETGVDSVLLPYRLNFDCDTPTFSPDGTKIAYSLEYEGITCTEWDRIYVIDFNPDDFSTPTNVDSETPAELALLGNFPNPFNPSTTIRFSLESADVITLSVYNMAGQMVRDLVNDTAMTPGIHNVTWDGHDDFGRPVSSGVYLIRFEANNTIVTGRMLMMK